MCCRCLCRSYCLAVACSHISPPFTFITPTHAHTHFISLSHTHAHTHTHNTHTLGLYPLSALGCRKKSKSLIILIFVFIKSIFFFFWDTLSRFERWWKMLHKKESSYKRYTKGFLKISLQVETRPVIFQICSRAKLFPTLKDSTKIKNCRMDVFVLAWNFF